MAQMVQQVLLVQQVLQVLLVQRDRKVGRLT
jgi:hypothetical protein